jgi:NTP pyrophosphatase (non-canonical NTP hydrolase)
MTFSDAGVVRIRPRRARRVVMTMKTLQQIQNEVSYWHNDVFGPGRPLPTAKKCLEEASELHVAAKRLNWSEIRNECADVAIAVLALAAIGGFSLDTAIEEKLQQLRDPSRNQQQRDIERGITR